MQGVPDGARCCSIDGDADRVVFFTKHNGSFVLLDGDRISCLCAVYIKKLLQHAPQEAQQGVNMGVVQTAYANGASTDYITQTLKLKAACTPTGENACGVCMYGATFACAAQQKPGMV
jgi:phosphoacetylglucosamine mutase